MLGIILQMGDNYFFSEETQILKFVTKIGDENMVLKSAHGIDINAYLAYSEKYF